MGRKQNRKKKKNTKKISSFSIEELLLAPSSFDSFGETQYSLDSLKSLRKELKDAITQIYSKYFQHFCYIKSSRIANENPFLPVSKDELLIEKNYCNELTQKVKQLVHLDSLNDIYYTFCKSVNSFMSQIHSEIDQLNNSDPRLQIACLAESYFVIQNSSKELGKVTSGIFDKKVDNITCENITKLAFYNNVLKQFSEKIKFLENIENLPVVEEMSGLEQELKDLEKKMQNLYSNSKNQNIDYLSPNYSYCVDDILKYINGDPKDKKKVRRRRVSKASTAETSGSPFDKRSRDDMIQCLEHSQGESELDKEIEEFRFKLDSAQPLCYKPKLKVSEEWLKKIRSLIMKDND